MFDSYIDSSGLLQERYREDQQLDSTLFIICTRGECCIRVNSSEYTLTADSLITLLPNSVIRVVSQAPDTELYIVSFKQKIFSSTELSALILEHVILIIETPVIKFDHSTIEIMCEYNRLLARIKANTTMSANNKFANLILSQFIVGIGTTYEMINDMALETNRAKSLVTRLTRLIIVHYKEERSAKFYADKMCISPQHLSSVVKQVTNRTITDIIAIFVVIHAQTKLASTDLSIGEIAAELHFDDISVFGRYFKRYTKLSPRQYRQR